MLRGRYFISIARELFPTPPLDYLWPSIAQFFSDLLKRRVAIAAGVGMLFGWVPPTSGYRPVQAALLQQLLVQSAV